MVRHDGRQRRNDGVDGNLARAREGWSKALEDHPFVSVDDLFDELARDEAQWWHEARSDVFTRIHENGVLEMGPAAGSLVEMLNVTLPKIETWAQAAGVTEIHVQAGREGWERALKERGYEVAAIILRKKL